MAQVTNHISPSNAPSHPRSHHPVPTAPSHPRGQQHETPQDRAHISAEARHGRGYSALRERSFQQASGFLSRLDNATGNWASWSMERASSLTQSGFNHLGRFLGEGAEAAMSPTGMMSVAMRHGGAREAARLERQGHSAEAERVRRSTQRAGAFLNPQNPGHYVNNMVQAVVGDSIGHSVAGVFDALGHPVRTLQGLDRLHQMVNPVYSLQASALSAATGESPLTPFRENIQTARNVGSGIAASYSQTARDHGTEGAVARGAFEIFSTVLSGGEAVAPNAVRVTEAVEHVPGLAILNEAREWGERARMTEHAVNGAHHEGHH